MHLLQDKVAIISGAGHPKGIGKATAALFLTHGARLALLDIDQAAVEQTARELDPSGQRVRAWACDISSRDQCFAVVQQVAEWTGQQVDVLVNNAGLTQKNPFLNISEADLDKILSVNLKGTFYLSQAVAPLMAQRQAGAIVCISSMSAQQGGGVFGGSHYCAAKSGVLGLARAMARELGPMGIRVNSITPGLITTDFSRTGRSDEAKDEQVKDCPLQRAGRPHEIAGGCLFLASELSSYMTGEILNINGGAYMN